MTWLYDRIVPPEALRWGRLTRERMAWHEDRLSFLARRMQSLYVGPFADDLQALMDAFAAVPTAPDWTGARP